MRRRLARTLTTLLLLAASPAAAFRVQRLPALKDNLADSSTEISSVAGLSNGGYVVAATLDLYTDTRVMAQVFGRDGQRIGPELRCGEGPGASQIGRGRVIASGDGFVLACESYHAGSDTLTTVEFRRYDHDGKPLGPPVVVGDQLFTQLLGLHQGVVGSFLLHLSQNDGVEVSENVGRVYDADGQQVSGFRSDHFAVQGVLPLEDGFLVASRGPGRGKGKAYGPVLVQRLATDGSSRGPLRRLGRTSTALPVFLIPGPGGRSALSWRTTKRVSREEFAHVLLLHASGAYDGPTVTVPVPRLGLGDETAGPVVAALPAKDGFALLWTPEALVRHKPDKPWQDWPTVWEHHALVQRYSATGRPIGRIVEIGTMASLDQQLAFLPRTASFVVSGAERSGWEDWRGTRTLWRIDLASTPGRTSP